MKGNSRKGLRGLTAQEIFERVYRGRSIKFEQLLAANQHLDFSPDEVLLDTFLTPEILLKSPITSSPMDTVTTARMGIGMADVGGLGFIHNNLDSFQQKRDAGKVKFGGLVTNPFVLSTDRGLESLEFVREKYSHVPITEDGKPNGRLVGVIPKSFRPRPHYETIQDCLSDESVRSPATILREEILYANGVVNKEKALAVMYEKAATALTVIDESHRLVGLIIASDLKVSSNASALATIDSEGRRRVGAAITTVPEDYERRVPQLVDIGVDVLCVDTAHGDSKFVAQTIAWIKQRYPAMQIIAGNISTAEAAHFLVDAGVDALRVGNGPGGACSTHEVTHTGAESAVGVYRVAAALCGSDKTIIVDGGIRSSGDIFIALALGGDVVMCGTYLAPLMESAAPLVTIVVDGKPTLRKRHRGMASASAQRDRVVARYGAEQTRMPEGKEVYLEPEQRPLPEFISLTMAGVRQAFAYVGVRSIPELHEKVRKGEITFDVSL